MSVTYTVGMDDVRIAAVVARIRREAMMEADVVVRELLSLMADVERAGRMGSCPWCCENGGSEFAETIDHAKGCPVFGPIGVMRDRRRELAEVMLDKEGTAKVEAWLREQDEARDEGRTG